MSKYRITAEVSHPAGTSRRHRQLGPRDIQRLVPAVAMPSGKNVQPLELNDSGSRGTRAGALAGIDIGGTKIRWILMKNHRVLMAREVKMFGNKKSFEHCLRRILIELRKRGIRKVGIGTASVLSGTVLTHSRNLPFIRNFNFADFVPKGMSFRVDNDARCFARAEAVLGRTKNISPVLALTLGTGVGRGLIKNGRVIPVKCFEHAEKWEGEYQKYRKSPASVLAKSFAADMANIIGTFKPKAIVLGGGTLRKSGLFSLIKKELKKLNPELRIYRSRFRQNAAVVGATLLVD